jgi:hypothetical protein
MGTSSSSTGPGGRSPLIPEGTDATPGAPIPPLELNRFQPFRIAFGNFARGGGGATSSLRSALGRYAKTSTGGAGVGPRRFGPAYTSGGSLFSLLAEMQGGGNGAASAGVDLSGLVGRSIAFAAQEIASVLAPDGIDADRVAVAINEALTEVLPDDDTFDPSAMTADQIVEILVDYLARILFQQVTEDAGSAWNRAPSEARTIEAENELFDLIKIAMDQHLAPRLANGVGRLTQADVSRAQLAAMQDVWREWESLE